MASFLQYFVDRWNNWVGDSDMERAIRKYLSTIGFFGDTAKLRNVRLVAVQRPGWIQVFRFEVTARVRPEESDEDGPDHAAEYSSLYGLIREDARKNHQDISVFDDEEDRRALFAEWSEDLICLRGAHGLTKRGDVRNP